MKMILFIKNLFISKKIQNPYYKGYTNPFFGGYVNPYEPNPDYAPKEPPKPMARNLNKILK